MISIKALVSALPPVKALRAEKWRRRAVAGLIPKSALDSAQGDPERKRALIGTRKQREPAVARWARELAEAGVPPQTAQEMLWCRLAYGFSFPEYRCYGFENRTEEERLSFFSDRESVLLSYWLNDLDGMALFSDKWQTYCRFKPLYGRDAVRLRSDDDYGAFLRFFEIHPTAIVKPVSGSCGAGVKKTGIGRGQDPRELFTALRSGGDMLLEEPIVQSPALATFHPASVNTVRIVTFYGRDGARILWAFLKTGRGGSLTDNGASGGILAGIDPAAGCVSTDGVDENGQRYKLHPDTGLPFAGFCLPDWEALKNLCVSAAACVPKVRMIGWDLAHTDGGWRVVEGNAQSELIGPQAVFHLGMRREIMDLLKELRLPTDAYRA